MVDAFIENTRLGGWKITSTTQEKGHDEFHPDIARTYENNGHHLAPTSKEQAEERGINGFNGLSTCFDQFEAIDVKTTNDNGTEFEDLNVSNKGGNLVLEARLAPARHLLGQAMRDFVEEHDGHLSDDDLRERSPRMANASILAPVEKEGNFYILCQIKGKDILGAGDVHASLYAGGITTKSLESGHENPIVHSLEKGVTDKLGLNYSDLDVSSAAFILNEQGLGMINVGTVAKNVNVEGILGAYETFSTDKLKAGKSLAIDGLVMVPVDVNNGGFDYNNMTAHIATDKGLESTSQYKHKSLRPYTEAVDAYFQNLDNVKYIFDRAGINIGR